MFPRSVFLALGLAVLVLSIALVTADSDDNMADALKILQQLDRYYSQVARPRLTRSESPGVSQSSEEPSLARAVRLLQLHSLDKFYSHHTRPRFGKRAFMHSAWERENPVEAERPDSWLPFPRRR